MQRPLPGQAERGRPTGARTGRSSARRPGEDGWPPRLLLALTFSTGMVDAVGYLGLDRVFVGNMTGNVAILGMGLTGAEGLPVAGPALALGAFSVGALTAGRWLGRRPRTWGGRTTALLVVVGVLVAGVAGTLAVLDVPPTPVGRSGPGWLLLVTTALALAMGVQAGAARRLGVADVTTVAVTSALTGLAAETAAGSVEHWRRRAGAVALILGGAAAGALLLRVHIAAGLGAAAVVMLAVAGAGHATRPPPG